MKKRAQLTIFIMVAVVIVIAIILVFLLMKTDQNSTVNEEYWKSDSARQKIDNVNDYFHDCIDSTSKEALILIAFQGGYYKHPLNYLNYKPSFFPYYYYEGMISFPTLKDIETNLGDYVSDKMAECINNADFGLMKAESTFAETLVNISYQNVYFSVDMDITLESEGNKKTIQLKESEVNYNSSLYEIYEVVEYITNSHKEDSEYYCVNCVSEMVEERGLYIYYFPFSIDPLTTGVMIYENRTNLADPYTYIFLNKYTGSEKTQKLNPLIIPQNS
ncbi:MAG: hypothetical protein KKF65_03090 [Nanoarchaeota archaeon]|nr:hypothetical protein [Nanoarchaeota archaeon]